MKRSILKRLVRYVVAAEQGEERLQHAFRRLLGKVGIAGSLLDVGAGDGAFTKEYSRTLKIPEGEVYGIEIVEQKLQALEEAGIHSTKLDLENENFPFSDESFEVISCNQVLEHLKNMFQPLLEMERTLKTNGYLVIGIPNLAALHNRILLAIGRQPICSHINGPHVRCFAHKGFGDFLRANSNFRMVGVAGASVYPLPYPLVQCAARVFPGLSAYTFYLLKKVKHDIQSSTWRTWSPLGRGNSQKKDL
jgi:SAM-dependent methyltransferase